MYVLMQIAFLFIVLLCLPPKKRVTVAYHMSVGRSVCRLNILLPNDN